MSIETRVTLEAQIEAAIRLHEPRISLQRIIVNADPDKNGYTVSIFYTPNNDSGLINLDFFLKRLR